MSKQHSKLVVIENLWGWHKPNTDVANIPIWSVFLRLIIILLTIKAYKRKKKRG